MFELRNKPVYLEFSEENENRLLEEKIQRLLPHYSLYSGAAETELTSDITWHWHSEFEFGYVVSGKILYKTSRRELVLCGGDVIFINSGVLHFLRPLPSDEPVKLYTQFIGSEFLAEPGSAEEERYIRPVSAQQTLDAVAVRYDRNENDFLNGVKKGIQLAEHRPPFYEFKLKSLFLTLWEEVYSWASERPFPTEKQLSTGDQRVKKMMIYIQRHFQEELSVADIAAFGHVSERECYRLFKEWLDQTPADFILSVRIRKAWELLAYTEKSILEIAVESGFGSSSYFGKRFKECCGVTPVQCRRRLKGTHSR